MKALRVCRDAAAERLLGARPGVQELLQAARGASRLSLVTLDVVRQEVCGPHISSCGTPESLSISLLVRLSEAPARPPPNAGPSIWIARLPGTREIASVELLLRGEPHPAARGAAAFPSRYVGRQATCQQARTRRPPVAASVKTSCLPVRRRGSKTKPARGRRAISQRARFEVPHARRRSRCRIQLTVPRARLLQTNFSGLAAAARRGDQTEPKQTPSMAGSGTTGALLVAIWPV